MTFDFPTLLIAVTFASQILVLSFICQEQMYRAWRRARLKYSPREYPRLYPIAPERIERQNHFLRALHIVIGVGAAGVLVASLASGSNAQRLTSLMLTAYLVQMLPPLLRLPLQFKMIKALRAMPAPDVRSAELRPWRITDFVSPTVIALGLAASTLALACVGYFYLANPQNLKLHVIGLGLNVLLLARMLRVLLGSAAIPRPDPYMSSEGVFEARRRRLRMLFRGALFLGVYVIFMEMYAARMVQFDFVYLAAGVSILGQLFYLRITRVMLHALATRDLSAYRT